MDPTKRQWQAQAKKLDDARRSIPEIDPDELEALIDRAVTEVRANKHLPQA